MAKAEKITVELSRYDRQLLRQLIDKLGVSKEDAPGAEKTIKRLTEPVIKESGESIRSRELRGDSYIPSGEGDWQLMNEEKVGKDD